MEFRNREELNDFLNTLKYIGVGIQWQSLLDKKTNQVYKIFSGEKLEGADYGYTCNDVMGLSHIKNDIFICTSLTKMHNPSLFLFNFVV